MTATIADMARQYRIALGHYGGDKVKARAVLEYWLRGIHDADVIRNRVHGIGGEGK